MSTIVQRIATLLRRLVGRSRRAQRSRELEAELALHAELLEREFHESGLSASDARDAALRRMGNRTNIAEASWDLLGLGALDVLVRDSKNALRAMRRSPGYATTVVLVLTFGIGAAVTIYSVLDHVLLRPLVYPDSARLVALYQRGLEGNERLVSNPTLRDWQRSSPEFDGMAYIRGDSHTLLAPGGPENVVTAYVSEGFFGLMRVRPELGRSFAPDEERPAAPDVIVISHELWARAFAADPHVIGRVVTLDSGHAVVVGVMPEAFAYPSWARLWRPLGQLVGRDSMLDRRDFHADSRAIGRLRPGIDVARASTLLSSVQQRIALDFPKDEGTFNGAELVPLRTEIVGDIGPALWALGGAIALILLIACVNVANLAAVRGESRSREMAVRLALGASRAQVSRQLLMETLALALTGTVLGICVARVAVDWLRASTPFDLPRANEIAVDVHALLFAVFLALTATLLFGLLPVLRVGAPGGAIGTLLGARPGAGGTKSQTRIRSALTCAQFALALVLLAGAGLLLQSYRQLQSVQLGFDPHQLLEDVVYPPKSKYALDARASYDLYARLVERLRTVPGVEEAAFVNFMPPGSAGMPTRIEVPGRTISSDDIATYITATDGYQRAMRMPLLRGRWFTADDMRSPGDGIVISETVAHRYWPNSDAIGKALTIFRSSQGRPDFGKAAPSVVIGVVGSVRQHGPGNDPDDAVYVPLSAEPWPWGHLVVRVRSQGAASNASLRRAIEEIEPALVSSDSSETVFNSVEGSLAEMLAPRRYILSLLGAFSACALLLAALGIYGVTSYSVARRTQELGVRRALGAAQGSILGTVMLRGIVPALLGSAIGLVSMFGLVHLIQHMLFETSALDPVVLVATPIVLLAIGLLACYVPARRAMRVDPMIALRAE